MDVSHISLITFSIYIAYMHVDDGYIVISFILSLGSTSGQLPVIKTWINLRVECKSISNDFVHLIKFLPPHTHCSLTGWKNYSYKRLFLGETTSNKEYIIWIRWTILTYIWGASLSETFSCKNLWKLKIKNQITSHTRYY